MHGLKTGADGGFSHGQTRRVSDFTKTMNKPMKFGAFRETRRIFSGLMYKRIA